jgi:hypothetical protein
LFLHFPVPGSGNGEIYWLIANWVAYDLNAKGAASSSTAKRKRSR